MSGITKAERDMLIGVQDKPLAMKHNDNKPKLSLLSTDILELLLPPDTSYHIVDIVCAISKAGHSVNIEEITRNIEKAVCLIRDYIGSEHAIRFCCMGLEFGTKKYIKNNWKTGFYWSELIDAALRHVVLGVAQGEDIDTESSNPHWGLALCELMFMLHSVNNYPDNNDIF